MIDIDIANASIAEVLAHLLEVQGHSGIDPHKLNNGHAIFPHVSCRVWKSGGYNRSTCPACIALRKYRLDLGESEEQMLERFHQYDDRGH